MKTAFFRFEASSTIGAGHAMRSCVIADELVERGWDCQIVTSAETYDFIKSLERFKRIDPEQFYNQPANCDLLVIDNYDLDYTYGRHFRTYAKKLLVIDDLANRQHDCDILLDQTYGRDENDYKSLVSNGCEILTGSDYALIRKEFVELRQKALEKRRNTIKIKRVLISMGGGDVIHWTIEALKMLQDVSFQGEIDISIGFSVKDQSALDQFIETLSNKVTIHVNGNMSELNCNADFAIGAAGSSVWERACLGLPQFLIMTADNQKEIVKLFSGLVFSELYKNLQDNYQNYEKNISAHIDGLGCLRTINYIEENHDKNGRVISHTKIKEEDLNLVFQWQSIPSIRAFSFNQDTPSLEAHTKWFLSKLKDGNTIFEKIMANEEPSGALRLDYCDDGSWILSWYILPNFQGCGIGTFALDFAKKLAQNKTIKAYVFNENVFSHRAMNKAEFRVKKKDEKGINYVY